MAVNLGSMGPILRPGVEAAAVWAEYARANPADPEVVRRKAEAAVRQKAYEERNKYLDWCVASGASPVRGGKIA